MDKKLYDNYINILKEELVPALGCTEPIAIAFAGAKVREVLGDMPESVVVKCSGNIIKNVKGVTVPNSNGLKGIDVAAVLGIVGGDASKNLEVLSSIKQEDIDNTKILLKTDFCKCELIENVENLYIIIEAKNKKSNAVVEIRNGHTNITKIIKDGKEIFKSDDNSSSDSNTDR